METACGDHDQRCGPEIFEYTANKADGVVLLISESVTDNWNAATVSGTTGRSQFTAGNCISVSGTQPLSLEQQNGLNLQPNQVRNIVEGELETPERCQNIVEGELETRERCQNIVEEGELETRERCQNIVEGELETRERCQNIVEGELETRERGQNIVEGELETRERGQNIVEGELETRERGQNIVEGELETRERGQNSDLKQHSNSFESPSTGTAFITNGLRLGSSRQRRTVACVVRGGTVYLAGRFEIRLRRVIGVDEMGSFLLTVCYRVILTALGVVAAPFYCGLIFINVATAVIARVKFKSYKRMVEGSDLICVSQFLRLHGDVAEFLYFKLYWNTSAGMPTSEEKLTICQLLRARAIKVTEDPKYWKLRCKIQKFLGCYFWIERNASEGAPFNLVNVFDGPMDELVEQSNVRNRQIHRRRMWSLDVCEDGVVASFSHSLGDAVSLEALLQTLVAKNDRPVEMQPPRRDPLPLWKLFFALLRVPVDLFTFFHWETRNCAAQLFHPHRIFIDLPPIPTESLKQLALSRHATINQLLLANFSRTIKRYCGYLHARYICSCSHNETPHFRLPIGVAVSTRTAHSIQDPTRALSNDVSIAIIETSQIKHGTFDEEIRAAQEKCREKFDSLEAYSMSALQQFLSTIPHWIADLFIGGETARTGEIANILGPSFPLTLIGGREISMLRCNTFEPMSEERLNASSPSPVERLNTSSPSQIQRLNTRTPEHKLSVSSRTPEHKLSVSNTTPEHKLSVSSRTPERKLSVSSRTPERKLSVSSRTPERKLSVSSRTPEHKLSVSSRTPEHKLSVSSRTPEHKLSVSSRTPEHKLSVSSRTPEHKLSVSSRTPEHKLSVSSRTPEHKLSVSSRTPEHKLSVSSRTPEHKLSVSSRTPEHKLSVSSRTPEHKLSVSSRTPEHKLSVSSRTPEHKLSVSSRTPEHKLSVSSRTPEHKLSVSSRTPERKLSVSSRTPERKLSVSSRTPERKLSVSSRTPEHKLSVSSRTPEHKLSVSSRTPEHKLSVSSRTPEHKLSVSSRTPEHKLSVSSRTPERKLSVSSRTPERKLSVSSRTPERKLSVSSRTPEHNTRYRQDFCKSYLNALISRISNAFNCRKRKQSFSKLFRFHPKSTLPQPWCKGRGPLPGNRTLADEV
ncbi:unnamed protein product [Cyprideis torosa]|uniref:Uncharacterized protein n=1 Tax=Cyprideis torosa TaxID=163714 RepID=A0A7R8W8C8_9CRUS|nr:unnamed protein product [Cyprideis torosa]CAG0887359.1 unnamed protein product [Cyprideis torosa]